MHEFTADNMINVEYAVISVDWQSADRSRYRELTTKYFP